MCSLYGFDMITMIFYISAMATWLGCSATCSVALQQQVLTVSVMQDKQDSPSAMAETTSWPALWIPKAEKTWTGWAPSKIG